MSVEFVLIAESGVLEKQAILLCESIREFGGVYAKSDIKILQPREEKRISHSGRLRFQSLGAEVVEMSIVSPCPEYGTTYRIFACEEYERAAQADCLVFMDSDTVLLSESDLELEEADVAARPVDVQGMCTSGKDDPKDAYWQNLCRACGVDYDSIPLLTTTVERIEVKASYNGGLTVVKKQAGLFAKTADFFRQSILGDLIPWPDRDTPFPTGHGIVSGEGLELWGSAQACLSLAITALNLSVRILPPSLNFPLHFYSELLPQIETGAIPLISHVHYHHLFRSNPQDNPILAGQPGFPSGSVEWLKEHAGELYELE